eukprot:gene19720-21666_t
MATIFVKPKKFFPVTSFLVTLRGLFNNKFSQSSEAENIKLYGLPRISYRIYPDNNDKKRAPILIAHAMFGSKDNWHTMAQSMAKDTGREVIAFDLRNHGNSEHHPVMSYAAMTHDITHLMKKLSIQRCVLLGHSMAGKVVASTALQNSDLIEKLIVVDSAPTVTLLAEEARQCIEAMSVVDMSKIKDKRDADAALSNNIKHFGVRQFLLTNLIKTQHGYNWRINLNYFKINTSDLIDFPDFNGMQYNGEVLFIGGTNSRYITEQEVPAILRFFPNAKICHIKDAGHWVHIEQPERFKEKVIHFINS